MSQILYALIAKDSNIIAEYTNFDGDFADIAKELINKYPQSSLKKSYTKDNYIFTFYSENQYSFCCMTQNNVTKETSFAFLDQLGNIFYNEFQKLGANKKDLGKSWSSHLTAILKNLMEEYSEKKDILTEAEQELLKVADITKQNIDKMVDRGIRIDLLVDKTAKLKQKSDKFSYNTRKLNKQMWSQKLKIYIFIFVIVMLIGLFGYFYLKI